MSQGAATYKAISTQTAYFIELMKQKEEAAISYAQSYGDVNNGIVAQFLKASHNAAEDEGKSIEQDAITNIISASVGAAGMLGTIGAHLATLTGGLHDEIEKKQLMKTELDSGMKGTIILENGDSELISGPADEKVAERISSWEKGGKNLDSYRMDLKKLEGQNRLDVEESNNISKRAIEHAKNNPQTREKISKEIDDKIHDLREQIKKKEGYFGILNQTIHDLQDPIIKGASIKFTYDKADASSASRTEAAEAQVLSNVQQKQSSFIDSAQQEAASFLQAADSAASSLGQIVQVHG